MDIARAEHIVQSRECFRGLGEDNKSAHGAVKTMHNTEEHVARFVVLLFDILLHDVAERFIACFVALNDFAATLVDYDYVVVFVDYFHCLPVNKNTKRVYQNRSYGSWGSR